MYLLLLLNTHVKHILHGEYENELVILLRGLDGEGSKELVTGVPPLLDELHHREGFGVELHVVGVVPIGPVDRADVPLPSLIRLVLIVHDRVLHALGGFGSSVQNTRNGFGEETNPSLHQPLTETQEAVLLSTLEGLVEEASYALREALVEALASLLETLDQVLRFLHSHLFSLLYILLVHGE
jgi:hypothetical protein